MTEYAFIHSFTTGAGKAGKKLQNEDVNFWRKISGNFRKEWNKFPEIFHRKFSTGNFPPEI